MSTRPTPLYSAGPKAFRFQKRGSFYNPSSSLRQSVCGVPLVHARHCFFRSARSFGIAFFLGNESAITCAVVAVSIVWLIGVWFGGLYMVKRAVALSIDF